MRFDPEDYAFMAHYDRQRLGAQIAGLGKQGLMRLVTLAVSMVIVLIISAAAGSLHPTAWYSTTRYAAIFLIVSLVLIAVAQIIEKVAKKPTSTAFHVGILAVAIVASNLLLYPVYLLIAVINSYATAIREFIAILNVLHIQAAVSDAQSLLSAIQAVKVVLIAMLIVGGVALVAAIIMLVVWLVTPRSLGWAHRQVINIALMAPPVMLLVCCAGLVFVGKYLVPQAEKKLGLTNLPTNTVLPAMAIFADWLIWLLIGGMLITTMLVISGVAKQAMANILLARMPQGNALRVDALGMVVDDVRGPQRVTWTENVAIAGRQRGPLPGPELVIGRRGQRPWSVPFMYLDVMPGTVDSAIRAATQDTRAIDLTPLDKML